MALRSSGTDAQFLRNMHLVKGERFDLYVLSLFLLVTKLTIDDRERMVNRADKNVPLETARYGRGYEINTEFNLQWNCSRWEL